MASSTGSYDKRLTSYASTSTRDAELRQRRRQKTVACEICRVRKHRCDGKRPTCSPCQTGRRACYYIADPGTTRINTLKCRHQVLMDRVHSLETLFGFLRDSPLWNARAALEWIRAGVSVDDVLEAVQHCIRPASQLPSLSLAGISTSLTTNSASLPGTPPQDIVSERMRLNFMPDVNFLS